MFEPSPIPRVFAEEPGTDFPAAVVRGLLARFENSPSGTELIETSRRDGPLYCVGPEVGV